MAARPAMVDSSARPARRFPASRSMPAVWDPIGSPSAALRGQASDFWDLGFGVVSLSLLCSGSGVVATSGSGFGLHTAIARGASGLLCCGSGVMATSDNESRLHTAKAGGPSGLLCLGSGVVATSGNGFTHAAKARSPSGLLCSGSGVAATSCNGSGLRAAKARRASGLLCSGSGLETISADENVPGNAPRWGVGGKRILGGHLLSAGGFPEAIGAVRAVAPTSMKTGSKSCITASAS